MDGLNAPLGFEDSRRASSNAFARLPKNTLMSAWIERGLLD
jgi:hypothetical protein